MANHSSRKKQIVLLIILIIFSIAACIMSETYRAPENIRRLSNVIAETQIPTIPYLQFQKSQYKRAKYYNVRYTYDKNIYNKEELAKEVKKRLENAGYVVPVFLLSQDRSYILAECDHFFFEISVFPDLLSVTVSDK